METKQCTRCSELKPITQFSKGTRKATTFRGAREVGKAVYKPTCKTCDAEYARKWRENNPDYNRRNKRSQREAAARGDTDPMLRSFVSCRVADAKARAAKSNLPYNLDNEYMLSLWDGVCALTGMPINTEKGSMYIGSIDKIQPELGYTKGNVQWVSWQVNRAKGEYTLGDLITMCRAVVERAETIPKGSRVK